MRWIVTLTMAVALVILVLMYAGVNFPIAISEDVLFVLIVAGTSGAVLITIFVIFSEESSKGSQDVSTNGFCGNYLPGVLVPAGATITATVSSILKLRTVLPEPLLLVVFAVCVLACIQASRR